MRYSKTIIFFLIAMLTLFMVPADISGQVTNAIGKSEKPTNSFEVQLASMSRIEVKTRKASVKVFSLEGSYGSGAYFIFEDHHVVFTAAHVVDTGDLAIVVDSLGNERVGTVAFRDPVNDFAIVLIPAFKDTEPLKFKLPTYNVKEKLGLELVYSGFPGHHNLTTIRGNIAGFNDPYFILHGAAWKGSSGSCVFDKSGNLTGVLVALSVGRFDDNRALIEDFVWVLPYSQINWEAARTALRSIN